MLARTARPAACALLATLAGCAEEPSFQLAWRITTDDTLTDPGEAPVLGTVTQCSEVGIEKVRLEVRGADDPVGVPLRFEHEYACFHSAFGEGELIDGPTLAPGEYVLDLIGLRRNGSEWLCPGEDDEGNAIEVGCVRDQASVTIREGELPELSFLLHAPVQCDDGIDNDRDGRVDGNDPACQFGEALESFDAGLTLFQLSVAILGSPLMEPRFVGIDSFQLTIDGQPLVAVEPSVGSGAAWPWRFDLLDERLDAGPHTLGMVGLDAEGGALTETQTIDFMVDSEAGAFVIHEFAFGSADFLAPIAGELAVAWAIGDSIAGPPCSFAGTTIDVMRVRVYEGDAPLALAVDELVLPPDTPLADAAVDPDGWLRFACDGGGRLKSAMEWIWTESGYAIELEGRVGDVACFASAITPLRPASSGQSSFGPVSLALPLMLDDLGNPPEGCPTMN